MGCSTSQAPKSSDKHKSSRWNRSKSKAVNHGPILHPSAPLSEATRGKAQPPNPQESTPVVAHLMGPPRGPPPILSNWQDASEKEAFAELLATNGINNYCMAGQRSKCERDEVRHLSQWSLNPGFDSDHVLGLSAETRAGRAADRPTTLNSEATSRAIKFDSEGKPLATSRSYQLGGAAHECAPNGVRRSQFVWDATSDDGRSSHMRLPAHSIQRPRMEACGAFPDSFNVPSHSKEQQRPATPWTTHERGTDRESRIGEVSGIAHSASVVPPSQPSFGTGLVDFEDLRHDSFIRPSACPQSLSAPLRSAAVVEQDRDPAPPQWFPPSLGMTPLDLDVEDVAGFTLLRPHDEEDLRSMNPTLPHHELQQRVAELLEEHRRNEIGRWPRPSTPRPSASSTSAPALQSSRPDAMVPFAPLIATTVRPAPSQVQVNDQESADWIRFIESRKTVPLDALPNLMPKGDVAPAPPIANGTLPRSRPKTPMIAAAEAALAFPWRAGTQSLLYGCHRVQTLPEGTATAEGRPAKSLQAGPLSNQSFLFPSEKALKACSTKMWAQTSGRPLRAASLPPLTFKGSKMGNQVGAFGTKNSKTKHRPSMSRGERYTLESSCAQRPHHQRQVSMPGCIEAF